ncbi:hypothetical protein F2Q69_00014093 [Brassica cretica]|uniref:Uncharacterized protein n=1 Tax=Brassica cretica TaxID=69181 RepID=A0A8S9QRW9_BRACR|nr:hypothetical protein F2Q69_00014093 [Brassica cretica]
MSGNTKDKVTVGNSAGKTTPATAAPMANVYAYATILEKIKNLVATCRHGKKTKTTSRFPHLNRKGNDKIYQTPQKLSHYRVGEISAHKSLSKKCFPETFRKNLRLLAEK